MQLEVVLLQLGCFAHGYVCDSTWLHRPVTCFESFLVWYVGHSAASNTDIEQGLSTELVLHLLQSFLQFADRELLGRVDHRGDLGNAPSFFSTLHLRGDQ